MLRSFFAVLCAALLPAVALEQDHVAAGATESVLPELRGDRPMPDRDLALALRLFNGQNVLDNKDRTVGMVDRAVPLSLHPRGGQTAVIAEGVVLRTDAFLAPDLGGMVTVLTVLPSTMLTMPAWFPPAAQRTAAPRKGSFVPVVPPRPTGSTLRFALAGGTVYFDDNNGAKVRQTGVRYPAAGEALVFFGETIQGEDRSQPPSSVLLLAGACSLQGQRCMSIDGSATVSDALAAQVPGGMVTAEAFSFAGAAIANPNREGIRGVAGSLEGRYNLGIGDLRKQAGPEIPMTPFAPATADETFVRAHVLETDAALTLGGLGVVTHTLVGVDRMLMGAMPKEHTIDVTQRGGLLWKDSGIVLPALLPAQYPLVEGGDYFLTVGRTSDNRWELRSAWRVVDDQVFSLDRLRTQVVARERTTYWKSTADFLKTLGMQ